MSLVTLSDAQDRVGEAVTQDHIDEVEEQLRRLIGPLTGERTETFFLPDRRDKGIVDGLYLSRYTDSVAITHDGTSLTNLTDYRLLDNYLVERNPESSTSWFEDMVATYSPNDEEQIRGVIYDWLSYRQTPAGLQSVRIGAYSETFYPTSGRSSDESAPSVADPVIAAFLRRILPSAGLGAFAGPFRYRSDRRDRTLITGGDGS